MPPKAPKIFIDTNVWFSAFFGSTNCQRVLKAYANKIITVIISEKVLNELVKNINKKFPDAFINLRIFFKSNPPVVLKDPNKIFLSVQQLVDPKDRLIFQSALESRAKYFVTGNIKHFNVKGIKEKLRIEVLTPKQAVDKLNL